MIDDKLKPVPAPAAPEEDDTALLEELIGINCTAAINVAPIFVQRLQAYARRQLGRAETVAARTAAKTEDAKAAKEAAANAAPPAPPAPLKG